MMNETFGKCQLKNSTQNSNSKQYINIVFDVVTSTSSVRDLSVLAQNT